MTENQRTEASTTHSSSHNNTVVLRIPKPNLQIVVLGFIALITLFQTFQLVRINSRVSSSTVKAAPAATTNSGNSAESNANVPQSMVGGC